MSCWRAEVLPVSFVVVSFVAGAALSWRRLGSLTIDTGRELELPLRLLQGERLYADVHYFWGPLAPQLNALMYRAFGASIDTLMWTGIGGAALMTACLFLIARAFVSRWAAASIAVAFVFASAFGHQYPIAIFNFVMPFNCSATYGIIAASWGLLLLLMHLRTGRVSYFVGAVAFAAAACFTKAEVILPVMASHFAFIAATWPLGRARYAGYAAGVAAIVVGYALCARGVGAALWTQNMGLLANQNSRHYVQITMGLDSMALSLVDVGASALLLCVALGVTVGIARAARRGRSPLVRALARLGAGAVCLAAFWAAPTPISLRALPLVLGLGLVAALGSALLRRRRPTRVQASRVVLLAFGLASLPRIALQAGLHHYGFYLVPVGLVGLAVISRACRRLAGGGPAARDALASAFSGAMIGLALAALRGSWPYYTEPRVVVDTPRGEIRLRNDWRSPAAVLRTLTSLPSGTRVLALPDGAGLVFVSGVTASREPVLTYAPMVLPDAASEARVLEAWERDPPDVVVWENQRTERAFGFTGFGVDYASRLREWLEARYVPLGDPSQPFVMLRRVR